MDVEAWAKLSSLAVGGWMAWTVGRRILSLSRLWLGATKSSLWSDMRRTIRSIGVSMVSKAAPAQGGMAPELFMLVAMSLSSVACILPWLLDQGFWIAGVIAGHARFALPARSILTELLGDSRFGEASQAVALGSRWAESLVVISMGALISSMAAKFLRRLSADSTPVGQAFAQEAALLARGAAARKERSDLDAIVAAAGNAARGKSSRL